MFHPSTSKLLAQVESVTGYRLSVTTEPAEKVRIYATMHSATPANPVHVVVLNERCAEWGDYITAVQCVMLLAQWEDPRGVSSYTVRNEKTAYLVDKACGSKGLRALPPAKARELAQDMVLGAGMCLAVAPAVYGLQAALWFALPAGVPADPITMLLFGSVLGTLYYRTQRIVPSIAAHMALNGVSLALAWLMAGQG